MAENKIICFSENKINENAYSKEDIEFAIKLVRTLCPNSLGAMDVENQLNEIIGSN